MLSLTDLTQILLWWLAIFVIGWAAFPIAFSVFKFLPDRGYSFAKVIGLLLVSYIVWLGASAGFLRNDLGSILLAILLVIALSVTLLIRQRSLTQDDPARSISTFLREKKRLVWSVEILFLIAFLLWAILRAYAPDKIMSAGGEKFMEMAFLNGILNSPKFPPIDPWLSGYAISYYYFGYVMMAVLTRLTGVAAGVGFDLYDAMLFSLTAIGSFGIVYNMVASTRRPEGREGFPLGFGLLGAFFVVILGNLEGLLESLYSRGLFSNTFWKWIDLPGLLENPVTGRWFPGNGGGWWWWRASRILQDRDLIFRPLGLSPITEFPFFSFLLGDNHPHVLALPYAILAIGLAFNMLRSVLGYQQNSETVSQRRIWWHAFGDSTIKRWLVFLFYALCLGALGFLNTWDMPIYIGLVVLAYGVARYARQRNMSSDVLIEAIFLGASLLAASLLLYLFFYFSFRTQASGILPYIFPPTRLPQFLVMFGTFIFILLSFLVVYVRWIKRQDSSAVVWKSFLRSWGVIILFCILLMSILLVAGLLSPTGRQLLSEAQLDPALVSVLGGMSAGQVIGAILSARLSNPWLFLLLTILIALVVTNVIRSVHLPASQNDSTPTPAAVQPADWFSMIMIFTGLALLFSVEFAYLRDTFMARMNTVFKFYYQGWLLLGISSAYGLYWLAAHGRAMVGRFWSSILLGGAILLITAGCIYPIYATYSRVAGFQYDPHLDGTSSLRAANPDDWAAIDWLRSDLAFQQQPGEFKLPMLLEAPGKSYNYEGRISAFTGIPALLGWSLHEGQWRGNYVQQGMREPDIEMIYTTPHADVAMELLNKWKINYVIVSPTETRYIQDLCQNPQRGCNLTTALRKFEAVLTPVFQQGNLTIYRVPGS